MGANQIKTGPTIAKWGDLKQFILSKDCMLGFNVGDGNSNNVGLVFLSVCLSVRNVFGQLCMHYREGGQ